MPLPAIERARRHSEAKLEKLRGRIPSVVPPGTIVIACGSYARREASPASDFDYFSIVRTAEEGIASAVWQAALKRAIAETVGVEPAKDGAFATVERAERMARNIGGQNDDNAKLTRRMLFLLEGTALSAEPDAREVRRSLLDRYLAAGLQDGLARFLLDDVIRYYRTIAVDYEFKTTEGERPKPWGLRNVKLMFSRRLLYASGLFAVAAACAADRQECRARLETLLDLAPIPRLIAIAGTNRTTALLESYDRFIDRLADAGLRRRLEALTFEDHDSPEFRTILAEGRLFSDALGALLQATFPAGHPIHRAMLF